MFPRPLTLALAATLLSTPLAAQQVPTVAPIPPLTGRPAADTAPLVPPTPPDTSADPANLARERQTPQALADELPADHDAAALAQLLVKLRTRASLMMIVAHPDDEDGGMLAYESRGAGARAAMLTLTRGEGGQNLMSADFGDALGLIRTQELLAEDRYTDVDQFFGTEVDFGFSKTKEETLSKWTHDRVLYDAVRSIRLYRPLVIASVFVGGPTDGHGHHQVSGEIAQEAWVAAADPKIFPEMHLPPWAPLKDYARVPFSRVSAEGMFDYATGKTIPTLFHNYISGVDSHVAPHATVLIHEGDPALELGQPALGVGGLTYVQFARLGLALQKTQIGPNVRLAPAGRSDTGYTLMGSRTCGSPDCPLPETESTLFDGIDVTLAGIASLAPAEKTLPAQLARLDTLLAHAQTLFKPENIELCAPPLRDALRSLDALIATLAKAPEANFDALHELKTKRVQLNDALVLAHHLTLTAELAAPGLPGVSLPAHTPAAGSAPSGFPEQDLPTTVSTLAATLTLTSDSANSYRILASQLTVNLAGEGIGTGAAGTIEPRTSRDFDLRLPYLGGLPATRPYFSRKSLAQPFYDIAVPALRNAPETPAPIVAHMQLDDEGVLLELSAIVPSPIDSNPLQALVVVPPVSIELTPARAIVAPAEKFIPVQVALRGERSTTAECAAKSGEPPEGVLAFLLPDSWTVQPAEQHYDPACPRAEFNFTLTPPAAFASGTKLEAQTLARAGLHNYGESFRAVGYPGLTLTNFYTPAIFRATSVDLKTAPGLHLAYLPGTGDPLPFYLANIGVEPTILTPADLTPEALDKYDAVILGVRAYSAHPDLNSDALKSYVAAGGVVIAQYMSGGFPPDAAPYPLTIPGDSAHNVVEEAQPVEVLEAKNALLHWPNTITPADFEGWVEERGHGFASSWSDKFLPLVETHDEAQDPQRGGLLLAPTGKGAYIYVALAVYRQLPEGVAGAYRLLANLVSYSKNPEREHPQ